MPVAALPLSLILLFAFVAGGAAERLRGGWPKLRGAATARWVRAVVWGLFALAMSGNAMTAIDTLLLANLAMLNSHRRWWDIGHDHGRAATDALMMLLLGLWRFGLSAAPLLAWSVLSDPPTLWGLVAGTSPLFAWSAWDGDWSVLWVLTVAVAHPLLYWLVRRFPPPVFPPALDAPTAYAEVAWGGAQLATLAFVLT